MILDRRRRHDRRRRNAGYGRWFFSAGPRNTPRAETQSHKGSHRIRARILRGRPISRNRNVTAAITR